MSSDFLYRLFRPRHWLRSYPTSWAWDAFVLEAIFRNDVRRVDEYKAMVGGKLVWVASYPHNYGGPYHGEVLPSARTADLLAEALAVSKGAIDRP